MAQPLQLNHLQFLESLLFSKSLTFPADAAKILAEVQTRVQDLVHEGENKLAEAAKNIVNAVDTTVDNIQGQEQPAQPADAQSTEASPAQTETAQPESPVEGQPAQGEATTQSEVAPAQPETQVLQ